MDNIQRSIGTQGSGVFNQAESLFDDLFIRKAPPLPASVKDLLVKLAPFWAILLIVLGVIGIILSSLSALFNVLGTLLSLASLSGSGVISSVLGLVQTVVGLILGGIILLFLFKSLNGLFNARAAGWRGLFQAQVVSVIYSVFAWVMGILTTVFVSSSFGLVAAIGGSILMIPVWLIFVGIGFYLLFQVKDRYL
jgi:hypothetical protein